MTTDILNSALQKINSAADLVGLEAVEVEYLGRKQGALTLAMKGLKDLAGVERQARGEELNKIKDEIVALLGAKKRVLKAAQWASAAESERLDVTQPALSRPFDRGLKVESADSTGHWHPVTIVQKELEQLFSRMGFMVLDGPELESDYYNFTALNIPESHPARDSMDTLYIKNHPNWLMSSHASSLDVRNKQKYGAPLREIHFCKCFRNEATDVRHEHTFHQFQGVVIDKGINMTHLKGTLETMVKNLYGKDTNLRLRPKYYPFVEPGVNGEVTCFLCQGKGCRVCKQSGWLEILGAGLIHPNVLKAGNIDPKVYQGFAFGAGLTRLVMLKYGIEDIRLLESGDLRFLEQF